MEHSLGQDSAPGFGSFDKSRVLDVRPLRRLVPVFTSASSNSSSSTPPFVCASPAGPFPPGVSPFFPFFISPESQTRLEQDRQTPSSIPVNSFRTPPPSAAGVTPNRYTGPSNGGDATPSGRITRSRVQQQQQQSQSGVDEEDGFSLSVADGENTRKVGRPKGKFRSQKRTRTSQDFNVTFPDVDIDAIVDNILSSYTNTLSESEGSKESVGYVLMYYDLLRRRILQIEEMKEGIPGVLRTGRPDLRAATLFMNKGIRTNAKKKIGTVPGVEVGDIFFFRMELCLVGLHGQSMGGIDYMGIKNSSEEEPLALSIVSSGGYEDHMQDGNELIYSGQGGNASNDNRKDKEIKDQKLERGNLALEKSLHRGNEVRVIRGVKDVFHPTGKVYVYDGLYKIYGSWVDKGKSGANVFKYRLVRLPGQPEAFTLWKSIEQWKETNAGRPGLILPDLTSGAENVPVSLVNDIDGEKGPAHFTYSPSLKYSKPVKLTDPTAGCNCSGGCLPGDSSCLCIQKNEENLPYTANGLLVNQKSLLHECGPSCKCPPNCRNRVSQGGLRVRLEVFKTKDKGWGLRSWDPIRAGAFLCEYAGEALNVSGIESLGDDRADDYSFDANRTCQPLGVLPGDSIEGPNAPFPLLISANTAGNVARFMNHSCSPNVIWQPVLRENKNESDLHVAFYAVGHIPPMKELTYDYGMILPGNPYQRKKLCLCGSVKCRSFFY
ncbi:histone-lysine N-methyltransferase, H3 lysine-9 specific SUVH1-like [Argentina anserina]|uniref:histone-lysine N-methyltransferase, H3 lysine-9 specific SUVH1-like n=1 Tax=Argentina anserina TaxID=57926 RepID=UPI0021768F7F|nr:histone-lysine N-methyltransferase, H3 lysine-9 specific SUVH1-like [Potentilla anserina]